MSREGIPIIEFPLRANFPSIPIEIAHFCQFNIRHFRERELRVSFILPVPFSAPWRAHRSASYACVEGNIPWCSRMR